MIDPRALVRCTKCDKHISGLSLEASATLKNLTHDQRVQWVLSCEKGGKHEFPGLRGETK